MVFFGKKYKYHTCPEKGISIGIYTDEKCIPARHSFYWHWSIKNLQTERRSFIIFNDRERKRYFKLQIFADPNLAAVLELSPLLEYELKRVDNHITLLLPPLIIKIKHGEKHEFKIFQPGFELTPGNYWIRVLFEIDNLECPSELVPITIVKPDN